MGDDDYIEVLKDHLFGLTLNVEGEMVRVSRTIQPVVMVDNKAVGVPGEGPSVRQLVDEDGKVVEVDAEQTQKNTLYITNYQNANMRPLFVGLPSTPSAAQTLKARPLIMMVPLTEAGGSIGATTIVPAVAGYTACASIHGIKAPAGTTDAANDWTFSIAAGTLVGPAEWSLNINAGRFHAFTLGSAGDGTPFEIRGTIGTDDNKALQIQAAALAIVGTVYWIYGTYWYE